MNVHLREKQVASPREVELDFIRGVAILAVLDFHFSAISPVWHFFASRGLQHFGWAGVNLFFVLSGFLVGGLLMREWKHKGAIDGVRFLKRRAFKIWPGYYFFLLIEILTKVHPLRTFLLGNALNVQNYTGTSIPHTWSLAVEEHFYLILTFLLVYASRKRLTPKSLFYWLFVISLVDVALREGLAHYGFSTEKFTHTRMDALLWGVMFAILYHFYPHRFFAAQNRVWILVVTVMASVLGLLFFPDPNRAFAVTIANVGSAALFLLLFKPGRPHSLVYRLVAAIGVYSYGIYLWHLSVRGPLKLLTSHLPGLLTPFVIHIAPYLAAIVLGVLMTKLVEFPALRLRERLVPRTFPQPGVPADSFVGQVEAPILMNERAEGVTVS